jgi:hypothetical protein
MREDWAGMKWEIERRGGGRKTWAEKHACDRVGAAPSFVGVVMRPRLRKLNKLRFRPRRRYFTAGDDTPNQFIGYAPSQLSLDPRMCVEKSEQQVGIRFRLSDSLFP